MVHLSVRAKTRRNRFPLNIELDSKMYGIKRIGIFNLVFILFVGCRKAKLSSSYIGDCHDTNRNFEPQAPA